jgi:pimeloyl-ACP methyl ester carboxylesterase
MKIYLQYFLLLLLALLIYSCGNEPAQKPLSINQPDTLNYDSTADVRNEKLSYSESYNRALSLFKTPYNEKDIATSFGNAHVIISGPEDGDPLVLLHGMNASSTMWYPNINALSQSHRVYAIDFLLEPGKSLCQSEISNTDEIVNWYYEIFDKLSLHHFSIVGASRGGWLAMNIALRSKSRIDKIVLLSPAQAFIWIKPNMKIISNITYTMSPKRKRLRNVLETMTNNVDNINQIYINQYYIASKEAEVSKCILQMRPFADEQLRSLNMPVLLLIGDNDIINNQNSIERANKYMKNVEAETIKDAGHFLSIDQSEIINKKILDFLTVKDPLIVKD